jgi:cytochrome c oxidase subunit 3
MPTTLPAPPARRPVVPSSVLGTLIFVVTETMFFVGMISAFTISKAGAPAGTWPVPGQPLLPAAATAVNTCALLLSGALLLGAQWMFARGRPTARHLVLASFLLGLLFVGLQGREWASLLGQGLTLTSSRLGGFFYFIVGTHALHALGALVFLGRVAWQFGRGRPDAELFYGSQTFWYFVVLMWPVIYVRVYF